MNVDQHLKVAQWHMEQARLHAASGDHKCGCPLNDHDRKAIEPLKPMWWKRRTPAPSLDRSVIPATNKTVLCAVFLAGSFFRNQSFGCKTHHYQKNRTHQNQSRIGGTGDQMILEPETVFHVESNRMHQPVAEGFRLDP